VILAVDQGTTGTTCLTLDRDLRVVGRGYRELPQHFPRPGWVEHDPEEIWTSVVEAAAEAGGDPDTVAITNQRETTILWERATGKPVAPAIVWQDRRTADRCRELDADLIRSRTGLVPDPYFSATKLEWLLREQGGREFLESEGVRVHPVLTIRQIADELSNKGKIDAAAATTIRAFIGK